MRWATARRRRPLAGALSAALLAAAFVLCTAVRVDAAPPTALSCAPAAHPAAKAVHAGAAHARCGIAKGRVSHVTRAPRKPSPPGRATPPVAALPPVQPILTVTGQAAFPVQLARAVAVPAAREEPAPGVAPGVVPPSLGGILSVPQPGLAGPSENGAELNVWQVVAATEGAALLAVAAVFVRRRRTSRTRSR